MNTPAEVLPMFQEEARKRQVEAGKTFGRGKEIAVDQKTQSYSVPATVTRARDEAAAMMSVSPSVP